MTRFRLLLASAAGVFFYVLISFTAGRDGLWAFEQMKTQRRLVSSRTVALKSINDELTLEQIALEKDMDVIASYARKLGYVKEGEKLIKVSGLGIQQKGLYDPGKVLKVENVRYISEWICKLTGIVFFVLVYIIFLLADYRKESQKINKRQNQNQKKACKQNSFETENVPLYEFTGK